MTEISVRSATNLWAGGFLAAAALHLLEGRRFARATRWGPNPGWQREIAIWNIAMTMALMRIRRDHVTAEREFLNVFATMTVLLATNHLVAAVRNPTATGNWLGAIANAAGLAIARSGR